MLRSGYLTNELAERDAGADCSPDEGAARSPACRHRPSYSYDSRPNLPLISEPTDDGTGAVAVGAIEYSAFVRGHPPLTLPPAEAHTRPMKRHAHKPAVNMCCGIITNGS